MQFLNAGWATATMSEGIRSGLEGGGKVVVDSVSQDNVLPMANLTNQVQFIRDSSVTPVGSGAYPMTTNEMGYFLWARFQAVNWRV
jgi:hypothetical protein